MITPYARIAGLTATALTLAALAVLYARADVGPMAAGHTAAALVVAEAARYAYRTAAQERAAAIAAERRARAHLSTDRILADRISLGWADLEDTCCLEHWASRGTAHEPSCMHWKEPTP
ncbi:hypothetical protein ACIQUE_29155 [Bacillus cereus]|uniref:hypothetical protein n=1 Tax=Bacillati TaxID=1783272 RepID=UPI00093CAAA5|nr:hypothetical protein [Streptomyces sp. CB03234]OKK06436.1 hypothetical protein AMK26_10475 [Streptomyces sp. CB03234]